MPVFLRSQPPWALLLGLMVCAQCQPAPVGADARKITDLADSVGGPMATGRVGDYLLENEHIRAVIEQPGASFLPTDLGGTLVDLDLRRPEAEFQKGRGLDQLGQIVPNVNLIRAAAREETHVRVSQSAQGAEVTVAATAEPTFKLLKALELVLNQEYGGEEPELRLYNEYELRPGESMLRVTSTLGINVPFCPPEPADGCGQRCDDLVYDDDCDCAEIPERCQTKGALVKGTPLPDRASASLLDILLGDLPRPLGSAACMADEDCDTGAGEHCASVTKPLGGVFNVCRGPEDRDAGLFLGDLLVFGADLTPFVPGLGYDTETDIRRTFDRGEDTLASPLAVRAVYATGDRVSVGYASPDGDMLVPLFSGPFSMGATHAVSCASGDVGCLDGAVVRFQRWISVGSGDVASAQAPLLRAWGAKTATIEGTVLRSPASEPVSGSQVYALSDPATLPCDDSCQSACPLPEGARATWSFEDIRGANRCRTRDSQFIDGMTAIETFAETDAGTDPIRDGRFKMELPAGDYFLLAGDEEGSWSRPVHVSAKAGHTRQVSLPLKPLSRLEYALIDEGGDPVAGKIIVGHLPGAACTADDQCAGTEQCLAARCTEPWQTLTPPEFGGHRPVDGVLKAEHSLSGQGSLLLPPGSYDVMFARGPHYTTDRKTVTLGDRGAAQVVGSVSRVVDRRGWVSANFHVHSEDSVDSRLAMEDRIKSFVAEDLEFFAATDHDSITDYTPVTKAMNAASVINHMPGAEITTQEYGHYLAFPLAHQVFSNGDKLRHNGAVQWRGLTPQGIMDAARAHAATDEQGAIPVLVDMPHPFDYFDFYQIDPVTLEPAASILALINPMLSAENFSGDFDLMELINTKSYSRIRRATLGEMVGYGEALDALLGQLDAGEIDAATYENRWLSLSLASARDVLHRTTEEQEAALSGLGADIACLCASNGDCGQGLVCDPSLMACVSPDAGTPEGEAEAAPKAGLCRMTRGVLDDWFQMLNRGVFRTGVGGGDEHGHDAGYLRTFVRLEGTSPPHIRARAVVEALQAGRAIVSNGPMVHFTVNGAQVGDRISVGEGGGVEIAVRVERAPWYDVDRLEIYRNGKLIRWANGCGQGLGTEDDDPDDLPCLTTNSDDVVVWNERLSDAPEADAWYSVAVYGLNGRTLSPVYESEVMAEIGTTEVTRQLFSIVPRLSSQRQPRKPSIHPVFPVALTNPIWVDVGGDGWTPPADPPTWCRKRDAGCEPAAD